MNKLQEYLGYLVLICLLAFGQPARSQICSVLSGFFLWGLLWFILSHIPRNRYLFASVSFFLVEAVRLSWMATPHYHGWGILLPFLFFSSVCAIQLLYFWNKLLKENELSYFKIFGLASFWTLLEWSRLYFLCGYPFNPMGLSLSGSLPTMQLASLFGIYGLTFFSLVFNLTAFKCFKEKRSTDLTIFTLMSASLVLFGFYRLGEDKKRLETKRVALVQTGWTLEDKGVVCSPYQKSLGEIEQLYYLLTQAKKAYKEKVDLIVFPEGAISEAKKKVASCAQIKTLFSWVFSEKKKEIESLFSLEGEVSYLDVFKALSTLCEAEIILGAFVESENQTERFCNAALWISPKKEVMWYGKRKLVPLGEYLPKGFPTFIASQYGVTSFFSEGKEKKVLGQKIKYLPTVCFEECFSHFTKKDKALDVDLLVNITNDIWFYPSLLAKQHLYHARLRALENGIPHIRACNSGITAVIDYKGRILQTLPESKADGRPYQGLLISDVPMRSISTVYSIWCDRSILAISTLFSFFYLVHIFKKNKIFQRSKLALVFKKKLS